MREVICTLVVAGCVLILAPLVEAYLRDEQTARLLERPGVTRVTLSEPLSGMYKLGCWATGTLLAAVGVGLAVRSAVVTGRLTEMHEIAADPEVATALFEILENQRVTEGRAALTLIPTESGLLRQLLAVGGVQGQAPSPAGQTLPQLLVTGGPQMAQDKPG